jgi:hypothetical protein
MTRASVLLLFVVLMLCRPGMAAAQVKVPPAEPPVGIRAYAVAFEWQRMTAAETFEAVTGSPAVTAFGAGVDVLRIARNLFARVGISAAKVDGQRVAIAGDEIIPFDPPIPIEVSMLPIEVGAGWRFAPRVRPGMRPTFANVTPYVGGGVLFVRYRETSEFDEPGEDAAVTFTGGTFFGGVDFSIGGGFIVGGEAQYRIVPNALGEGGASAHFGETDLGGVVLRLTVGYRR